MTLSWKRADRPAISSVAGYGSAAAPVPQEMSRAARSARGLIKTYITNLTGPGPDTIRT